MAMVSDGAEVPQAKRASDRIAQELRREIIAGAKIERTPILLERFGVSRPTLRQAFRVLESEQLIEVRHGSRNGVRVRRPGTDSVARLTGQTLQANGTTIEQLYEARETFEPVAARIVAKRSDRRDVASLRNAHAELTGLLDIEASVDLGMALARFHHLLVSLAGNEVLTLMSATIANLLERHQRNGKQLEKAGGPLRSTLEFRGRGVRSIGRLNRLVEEGDGERAEAHWRVHLMNASHFWLAGQDRYAVIDILD